MLVNNAGVNSNNGWKVCIDVMLIGVSLGVFHAIEKMSISKAQCCKYSVMGINGFSDPKNIEFTPTIYTREVSRAKMEKIDFGSHR